MVEPFEQLLEALRIQRAALPRRHKAQSEADFKDRHRRSPDRGGRLTIKPRDYSRLRAGTHQFGEHIAIEDNHSSNFMGSISSPWNSSITRSGPVFGNSAASSVPRPNSDFFSSL